MSRSRHEVTRSPSNAATAVKASNGSSKSTTPADTPASS